MVGISIEALKQKFKHNRQLLNRKIVGNQVSIGEAQLVFNL